MLTSKKKCKIKSIFIEMLIFVVLLFSYQYIIDTLSIIFRRNINTGDIMQPYMGVLLSFGISIVFAVLTILGIMLIKRISAKSEGWTLCDFHSISILYCCFDLLIVVNRNYKNFNYCKMVCGGNN